MINLLTWTFNSYWDTVILSLLCILVVFVVLVIISLLLSVLNKIPALDVKEKVVMKDGTEVDDNMMAAILVASIDYRKEIREDVKVVSCKEIESEDKK